MSCCRSAAMKKIRRLMSIRIRPRTAVRRHEIDPFASPMNEKISDNKTSDRSPLSGCAILITALLVLIFLMVFSVRTLFRQYDEIVKFTASEAKPLVTEALENRQAELAALKGRLVLFHQGLMIE